MGKRLKNIISENDFSKLFELCIGWESTYEQLAKPMVKEEAILSILL